MQDLSQSPVHFGKYLLDRELARGGMSRVFRARLRGPAGFEKTLVVKQILPELARDPSFIELFVNEANTLVQMSHPNLVPVYELGVVDGVYFLSMEWVEGATVAEILREGPLPEALVAHVGAQIAEALRYAHERFALVHRDVTPRNVIIDGEGHARLLDFGIAAKVARTGVDGPHALFGSPGYMPPEQLRCEALGPESDLFALGAVLYEALSGKAALPRSVKPEDAETPVSPLRDVDPTLAELVARMLSPDRSARPKTAAEVASALRRWLAERHPQGVEHELSLRAARAHRSRSDEPSRPLEHGTADASGRIEVRSIATSSVLDELLKQATERIEREPESTPEAGRVHEYVPEPPLSADPEAKATLRRYGRDFLALMAALAVGVYWAESRPRPEFAQGVIAQSDVDSRPITGRAAAPQEQATAAEAARPAEGAAVAASAPAASAPPPSAASTSTPAAKADDGAIEGAKKPAFVTLSATPWANVRVDGKLLGVTPQRRVPLAEGKHTLLFECPPLDKKARVPIDLAAAQSLQVVVDLHQDPAAVTIK